MNGKNKKGVLEWFMIIMFIISVVAVIIQVVSRRFLNNSVTWSNEVCRYSFLWVVFVGTAVLIKENGHICIDVVLTLVPEKFRNLLLLINYILIAILAATLTVLGVRLVIKTQGSLSSSMRLPINYILYLGLPIGFGLGFLQLMPKIYHQVRVVAGKEPSPPFGHHHDEEVTG